MFYSCSSKERCRRARGALPLSASVDNRRFGRLLFVTDSNRQKLAYELVPRLVGHDAQKNEAADCSNFAKLPELLRNS